MKTATITIRNDAATLRDAGHRAAAAIKTGKPKGATFAFATAEQLFRTISPKRWELIEHLQAIGPVSLRALARALDRGVRRVHDDVAALIEIGLIERNDDGLLLIAFQTIHIDMRLRAAA
jgi:predicted transcriptional regulator